MEIIRHMSDDQLRDMLLESDQQALQPVLAALPEAAREAAAREEHFWSQQREAIWSRITQREKHQRQLLGFLALAATAAIVAIGTLLTSHRTVPVPSPQQAMHQQIDPDQELLLAVENAVQNSGPAALEPAALLAEEINRHAMPVERPRMHKKERRDAN
jgi:hypothetical protein